MCRLKGSTLLKSDHFGSKYDESFFTVSYAALAYVPIAIGRKSGFSSLIFSTFSEIIYCTSFQNKKSEDNKIFLFSFKLYLFFFQKRRHAVFLIFGFKASGKKIHFQINTFFNG